MGLRMPQILQAKQIMNLVPSNRGGTDVPKGHFAIYVREANRKRYVIPLYYLNYPSFQCLLHQAKEEFGFNHSMGALTSHNSMHARNFYQAHLQFKFPIRKRRKLI